MMSRSSVLIAVVLAFGTACSSIPGMPRSGNAAHLNLATVAYVDSREGDIMDQVLRRLTARLPEVLEEAIADERERLQALETLLVAQQGQLMELTRRTQESEQSIAKFSEEARKQIEELELGASQIRSLTGELSSQVDALPSDTLRELNAALKTHLSRPKPSPAPAQAQAQDPASAPEPAPEASVPETKGG